jgi:CHRD domain
MRTLRFALGSGILVFALAASASGTTIFTAVLSGANEVPPNVSTATGSATVTLNGNTLTVDETFSGLIGGPASAAHIHCCAPIGTSVGVAVPFPGFPAATSGTYNMSFDLTLAASYSSAFLTASGGTAASAEAALIAALNAGQTYANIHDATFPGGEIRGQLRLIPEPATAGLLLLGLTPVLAVIRKRLSGAR